MTLLAKKIGDLTEEEIKQLEKPLGIKGRPFPTRKRVKLKLGNGSISHATKITVHEDNDKPHMVYSAHDYAFVSGEAMRKMPTPSMLPYFFDGLKRRELNSKKRIQFIKGTAGAGKTFMSEFTAEMRDPRGPIIIDCGQKNLAELLYETVLDFNQDKKFYTELDKRLAAGQMNELSLKLLEDHLGRAFKADENGKVSINWGKVGRPHDKDDGRPSAEIVKEALGALKEVARLEGLDSLGANALGMATQEGPLIRAWKEGREIILDEFNRGKKGSTSSLHSLLNFLAGMGSNITVENTLKEKGENENGQSFVFDRKDMRAGFFVTLTGNAEEDGDDVDELPQSVSSRIMPQTVPLATELDWQHRICQMMTGIPISTIYHSMATQWDNDPELFRKKLKEWRVMGLSEKDVAAIPELQMKLLDRWEDVMEASEKLAKFYAAWAELTNPDSELFAKGDNSLILMELSDTFFRETTIDFRKVVDHINEAMVARSSSILPEESEGYEAVDSSVPPLLDIDREGYDAAKYFGTNLTEIIEELVYATSYDQGRTALYKQLVSLMKECGLEKPFFHEAKASDRATIAALLDENPYSDHNPKLQAALVRDMACNLWRQKQDEVIPVNNTVLLDAAVMTKAMEKDKQELTALKEEQVRSATDNKQNPSATSDTPSSKPKDRKLPILNEDANAFSLVPIKYAQLLDTVSSIGFTGDNGGPDAGTAVPLEKMLGHDDVLVSLILPKFRERTLINLWVKTIHEGDAVTQELNGIKDEGLSMAMGTSASGLCLTTLCVAGNDNKESQLHILFNQDSERLIVVGDAPKLRLREQFKACQIDYIDRKEKNAALKIDRALGKMLDGRKDKKAEAKSLCNAFLIRNIVPSVENQDQIKLSALMLAKDAQTILPQYAVKP